MTEKNEDKISEARIELEEAQKKLLLEAYLSKIREDYCQFSIKQDFILEKLDNFIKGLEQIIKPLYDPQIAKEIREKAGLSQGDLSKKLGFRTLGHVKISKYETGRQLPSNPPKGEYAKKYLEWLKAQGYNPYNI